jgi:hypothetical protein
MGLSITPGRILMTDAAGNVRFDTNEKLFVPINYVTGSYTLPSYSARTFWDGANQSSHVDQTGGPVDNTYTLTAVNGFCNTVRGAFKVSASYGGFSTSSWYNAGGSYVHMWQGGAYGTTVLACGNINVCATAVYTLFCESGSLKLREQVHLFNEPGYCIPGGGNLNTLSMVGPTLDYKLVCGTFV